MATPVCSKSWFILLQVQAELRSMMCTSKKSWLRVMSASWDVTVAVVRSVARSDCHSGFSAVPPSATRCGKCTRSQLQLVHCSNRPPARQHLLVNINVVHLQKNIRSNSCHCWLSDRKKFEEFQHETPRNKKWIAEKWSLFTENFKCSGAMKNLCCSHIVTVTQKHEPGQCTNGRVAESPVLWEALRSDRQVLQEATSSDLYEIGPKYSLVGHHSKVPHFCPGQKLAWGRTMSHEPGRDQVQRRVKTALRVQMLTLFFCMS